MSWEGCADDVPELRTSRDMRAQATSEVSCTSRISTIGSIKLELRSRLMGTNVVMSERDVKDGNVLRHHDW